MDAAAFQESGVYYCRQLHIDSDSLSAASIDWESYDALDLVETVTGAKPKERTEVRACWSAAYLHIRYECSDSFARSTFTRRDEPLYEQDVVELFIDEAGDGRRYIELEVSPHNVVFDALISHDGESNVTDTDLAWQLDGLVSTAELLDGNTRVYTIHIPAGNFKRKLESGLIWRVNFYRIDEDPDGCREYQAWQATKAVNFHLPRQFGRLVFI
ncbi:hypothetical protein FHS16_001410 [Paenibacillus endophyticus]|uniref:Carbohydrate-binding domain-containing protein n=1 Tax=Paenibacillus endophyticus TaxID=1294268 RepID=A0A7W5C547_9BACL|nr:carbohydrate-binding family 9-like protein [Paenibacillus endophyticus]MBB3151367.1 hypothetical protein [Paenibacillus endophyticus]